MLPTPDSRWAIVHNIDTYEQYLEIVSERIYLKQEVNEHVRGIFKLVQRLIDLGYYEYEFFDLAALKAVLAFELALKKRWEELKLPGASNSKSLLDLIRWFFDNGYFEIDSDRYLDQIRQIRNNFAHPDFHAFGGPITSWHIEAVAGLINDLYEDVHLRKDRKQETKDLNSFLSTLVNPGALLVTMKGDQTLVYQFSAGFINNKASAKCYHFIYKPIFEIPEHYEKGGSVPVFPAFEISCHSIIVQDNQVKGLLKDGTEMFRLSIPTEDKADKLLAWHHKYKEYLQVLPHFTIGNLGNVNEKISRILTDFHKT